MSSRSKTVDPEQVKTDFLNLAFTTIMGHPANYFLSNHVGLLCPWADQGLGIQCREYYDILQKCGYHVSVYSFKPYNSTSSNPRLQSNPEEWNYPNIYYGSKVRELLILMTS